MSLVKGKLDKLEKIILFNYLDAFAFILLNFLSTNLQKKKEKSGKKSCLSNSFSVL
jgi:hypothetical protein